MDWVSGAASLINGLIAQHKLDAWYKLIFSMIFSGAVSFLYVCGTALVAKRSAAEAIGEGMVAAAVYCTVLYRRANDLTKGMSVALPEAEAGTEINSELQIITRAK